jgi:hypothetical protein
LRVGSASSRKLAVETYIYCRNRLWNRTNQQEKEMKRGISLFVIILFNTCLWCTAPSTPPSVSTSWIVGSWVSECCEEPRECVIGDSAYTGNYCWSFESKALRYFRRESDGSLCGRTYARWNLDTDSLYFIQPLPQKTPEPASGKAYRVKRTAVNRFDIHAEGKWISFSRM